MRGCLVCRCGVCRLRGRIFSRARRHSPLPFNIYPSPSTFTPRLQHSPLAFNIHPLPFPCPFQALQHASSCGQQVVGYYQANERLEDRELGAVGRKIAEKVHSLSKGSVGLVLDAQALKSYLKYAETNPQAAPETPLFQAWSCDARGQATAPARAALADSPRLYGALVEATTAGVHRRLVDFEDHLQDISLDWLNPALLP